MASPLDTLSGYGQAQPAPSLGQLKQQQVAEAAQTKQAELDPAAAQQKAYNTDLANLDTTQLRAKYGDTAVLDKANYDMGASLSGRIDAMGRTVPEMVNDFGASVAKGAVNLGSGIFGLAQMAGQGMAVQGQNWADPEQAQANMKAVEVGNARTARDFNAATTKLTDNITDAESLRSQLAEFRTSMSMQADQEANQQKYDQDVKNGQSPLFAGLAQLGRGIVQGGADVLRDPTYAGNFVAEQIPSLAIGPISKAAAVRSLTAGMTRAEATAYLGTEAGKEAVEKAGTRNLMAGIGLTEGSGAGQGTFQQVEGTSFDDLQKNSPQYRDLVSQGYSPADARSVLAQRAATDATLIQGPIAALTGKIAAKFELDPLGSAGATGLARVGHTATSIAREVGEETLQSGSGQLAQNIGTKAEADPTQSLTDGVGEQAGMGALGALGLSGAAQAPAAAAGAIAGTAKVSVDALKTASGAAMEGLNKAAAARTKLSPEDQAAADNQAADQSLRTAASEYDESAGRGPAETNDSSDEGNAAPNETETQPSRLQQLLDLHTIINHPNATEEQRKAATIAGTQMQQQMIQEYEGLEQQQQQGDNSPEIQAKKDAIEKAFNSPESVAIAQQFQKYQASAQQLNQANETIPDNVETATPEMQTAAQDVYSAAISDKPEDTPAPLYQKVLNNAQQLGLSQSQQASIQGAIAISNLVSQNKGMDLVNKDVTEGQGSHFISLKQHLKNFYTGLAANDTQMAQNAANRLGEFVGHMAGKSQAMDEAMQQYQANPAAGPVPAVNPLTGNNYQSLVAAAGRGKSQPMTASGKSQRLIPQIHSEATLLANTYNQLLADHPEIQGTPVEVAPLQFNAPQPAATPAATPAPKAPSTTGTDIRIGDRELTRAELQDLASGEVTPADLREKWAAETQTQSETTPETETAPAETTEAQPTQAEPEVTAEPVTELDTATQNLDNNAIPTENAEPVTANPEPVTTTPTTEESQDEAAQQPEPVDSGADTVEPVAAAEQVQTGAERLFANLTPEVNRTRGAKETDIDHEDRNSNAVLKYFAPAKAKSLFTKTADLVSKLGTMTAEELGKLLNTPAPINEAQMTGVQTLLNMNQQFRNVYQEALAGKLAKVKATNVPWRNIPVLYFSRMQEKNGGVRAQVSRHVTDAMGLSALKFAMDNLRAPTYSSTDDLAKDLGIQMTQLTPEMIEKFMSGSQSYSVIAERLAGSIMRTIGMAANENTPDNIRNGIPLSLAMDALGVMERMGLATVDSLKVDISTVPGVQDYRTFKSITFNKGEEGNLTELGQLSRDLGSQLDILSKLIDPDSKASAHIDSTPPVGGDQLGRSRTQKLSNRLKDMVRNLQKKPFYLNSDLHDLVQGMGEKKLGIMLGMRDTTNLNVVHKESVEGKNTSVRSAMESFALGMNDLTAAAGDRALGDVPVRFNWKIGSNMRAMMDSNTFNPQRHKMHRELMTGEPVTLDITNDKHVHEFQMAVAQALGVKVDRVSNDTAKADAAKTLADPTVRTAIDILKSQLGDYSNMTAADADAIIDAVGIAGEGMKSFHGLLAQAKYEHAQENGYNLFSNHLTFELDGKTDGPANALVHFGSAVFGDRFMGLLQKIGLFVNDKTSALNEFKGTDIYQTVAASMENTLRGTANNEDLKNQMTLLRLAGNVKYDDLDDVNTFSVTRNMAKNPVTQTVYSAGDSAKIRSLRKQIHDAMYEQLSNAVQNQQSLPADILKAIQAVTESDISDPSKYANFRFSPADEQLLEEKLTNGMGSMLNNAIDGVLGNVVRSGRTLAASATVQHAIFNRAFQDARQAKVDELRKSGQLASYNDLSSAQIQEVFDSVAHLAPIYHNALTSGTNVRDGLLMSDETQVGTKSNAESIFGDQTEIKTLGYDAPGARPAPMMTISSGDATMMALYFNQFSDALNVFDGLEVMPGNFDSAAKGINDAVFQGWQFNLLKGISDSFNAGTQIGPEFFAEQSDKSIAAVATAMGIKAKALRGMNRQGLIAAIQEKIVSQGMELQSLAQSIEAVKSVMFNELPTSTDHMAGHQQPVINRGDKALVDDPVAFVNERVQAYNQRQQTAEDTGISAPNTAIDRHLASVKAPDASGITQYTKDDILKAMNGYLNEVTGKAARVPQFVLAQISRSLPDDLTVHVGTKASITQHITEQFPDIGLEPNARLQGMTYGSQVFIANRSPETIMHELVHAATQNQLNQYFTDSSKLTPEQRGAITALNRIMNDFMGTSDFARENPELVQFGDHDDVRTLLHTLVAGNSRAEALNEFVAWSLTNPKLAQDLLDTPNENKPTHILQKLLNYIQKLLGIGKRGQSYFESVAGHVVEAMSAPADKTDGIATPLNQLNLDDLFARLQSERTSADHQAHLDQAYAHLRDNLLNQIKETNQPIAGITTAADQLNMDAIDPNISAVANGFIASGFDMNPQEQMIFKMLQATLQSNFENQPAKAVEVRKLFNEVANKITPADFMDATGSQLLASQRFEALFGEGQPGNEQLANFLAATQVNAPLRAKLREMFVQKAANKNQDWETRITKMVDDGMRWVANLGTGIKRSNEVQRRLDILTRNLTHFEAETRQNAIEQATSGIGDAAVQLNNLVNQKVSATGGWIEQNADALAAKVPTDVGSHLANFLLRGIAAMTNKGASGRLAEAALSTLNEGSANKAYGPIRDLIGEMIGITDSNRGVLELVGRAKSSVDKFRQIIRDQVPQLVNSRFSQPLSVEESTALHTGLGKTDAQSLLAHGYSHADIVKLFTDPAYRAQEIAATDSQLQGPRAQEQRAAIDALAHFMVTGENTIQHLLVNARQIAHMIGTGYKMNQKAAIADEPVIDKLLSLKAIDKLPQAYMDSVANVGTREMAANAADNGVTFSLNYLQSLRTRERDLADVNGIKGNIPSTFDSHKSIVVADAMQGADLIRRGYTKGARFYGDLQAPDHSDLHFYESSEGGRPQWNQGAMQTVAVTAGGVDPYTGRALSPVSMPRITGSTKVQNMRQRRATAINNGTAFLPGGRGNMRPVFNQHGAITAYEYSMPHALRDAKLDGNNDFARNLGIWEGRTQEEILSQAFNEKLVDELHKRYTADTANGTRTQEYIDITDKSTDPLVKEMYGLMPREMKEMVQAKFNGPLKVRKDMLNNAMGHRTASVKEIWDGNSRLAPEVQGAVKTVAAVLMGNAASRWLRKAERFQMEAVSGAKDFIVVRSLVVARDNIISNISQVVSHGMSPIKFVRKSAEAMTLADAYTKNERRMNELSLLINNQADTAKHAAYKREMESLRAENQRNPVHPLMLAGHLPTIAEGLSENDDHSMRNDFSEWINKQVEKVPQGVRTAAKYALLSRGTPLYAGLNRMIQYGDFTAKYALYDHLTNGQKQSSADAMRTLEDEFVNYSLLPSRARDWNERMGFTWFLNYKLRIQKVILRSMRDNPLKFLAIAGGGAAAGIPGVLESNLVTNSLAPNLGMSPLFRAHEMHPLWWLID